MKTPANLNIGISGLPNPELLANNRSRRSTEPAKSHFLRDLARYTDLYHIDLTLHTPLKPEIAQLYARQVASNQEFQFTAALGSVFTHDRELTPELVKRWKQGLFPLLERGRLAAATMQFPWAFRFTAENRSHLIEVRRAFHEFPLAAEFRHDSWLCEEAISTLINYHVGLVNIDQPKAFRAMPPTAVLTSGLSVVRFYGRGLAAPMRAFQPSHRPDEYLYTTDKLEDWLPRLRRLAASAVRTLVIFSNAPAEAALVNSLQIAEMMDSSTLEAPAALLSRFPVELGSFRSHRPVQPMLIGHGLRRGEAA